MKIIIIGPGATGCLFAALLHKAGHQCVLIDKNKDRASAITRQGIIIESASGTFEAKIPACTQPGKGFQPDMVMFCVKSFDTESAARHAASFIPNKTIILTLQNGLGNVETIEKHLPGTSILAGTTAQGVTLMDDGRVFHAGAGNTVIGALYKTGYKTAGKIAATFTEAKIPAHPTKFLLETLWSKLIINSAIGPVTALSGLKNGEILENAELRDLLRKTAVESAGTATACGIKYLYDDPVQATEEVCLKTAQNRSSMLQDLTASRKTEIEAINGMIVRSALTKNMKTPVNDYLINRIKEREA